MARLTDATSDFIAALQKAQSDLEWVERKLEAEFAEKHKSGQVNPLDLLTRIHKMKRDLPVLIEECTELLEAKQVCVDAARHHLVGNTESLDRLERRAGIMAQESRKETFDALQTALTEHDEKLKVSHQLNDVNRDELNAAFAHSVVV